MAGEKAAPEWRAPDLWVFQERGYQHEEAYLQHLETLGLNIVDLRDVDHNVRAFDKTRAAMKDGAAVIAQATLTDGRWFGRSDVLRRVERASNLGAWSYEVYDCKLARETKAATILQLSLYSELLSTVQGVVPAWMYVVPPAEQFQPEPYRVLDFAAYYRYVKARLGQAAERETDVTQPEPNPHCPVCRWWQECDFRWRKEDHLSLVAGISKLQRKQLHLWETATVERLAKLPLPLRNRPEHGSKEGYARVREQARVQVAGRSQGRPVHELLEIIDGRGLSRLPEPSPGDVFFDLEGDPFVGLSGREYLFGFVAEGEDGKPVYECTWALTPEEEKQAFVGFIDWAMARWAQYPAMHIYHFAPYEPSALKRLMGRYATREDELDRMLRSRLLVDLHIVTKQAIRASVEQYSLKTLEAFHGFERTVSLDESRRAMRQAEHSLELGRSTDLEQSVRKTMETYNGDDCHSTRSLRNWLERERTGLEQSGQKISRPIVLDGTPSATVEERQLRIASLIAELVSDVPTDRQQRTEEHAARWLLANLLDWHRRENKADWWEYFRLVDLPDEDLLDERSALAGLILVKRIGMVRKLPIDRYAFEKQETDIRAGDTVCERDGKIGLVLDINLADRTIDIKKTKKTANIHPSSIFADCKGPDTGTLAEALFRLATWVKTNGVDAPGAYRAARDLLLCRPPRLTNESGSLVRSGESTENAAKRIALSRSMTRFWPSRDLQALERPTRLHA